MQDQNHTQCYLCKCSEVLQSDTIVPLRSVLISVSVWATVLLVALVLLCTDPTTSVGLLSELQLESQCQHHLF